MKNLSNFSLLDFCNPAVKNDQSFKAICQALDPQLQSVVSNIQNAIIYGNLNNLPVNVLDFIALYHFNVDYYDTTLPKSTKLLLIKNVIQDKINKGTPSRVINILNQVFGYAELIEWWQDTPVAPANTFRIKLASGVTGTQLTNAYRAVIAGKNVRSWFLGFSTLNTVQGSMNIGAMMGEYDYQVISNATYRVTT